MSRFESSAVAALDHIDRLADAVVALRAQVPDLQRWGYELADTLTAGGRLLAAGNGGSAAQAQHLTSELVGRYRDDRPPFSAIALCTEPAAFTAIGNDYGIAAIFARQVRAHGRQGDVLIALSTSGESANVVAAVSAAAELDMETWALTGPRPNSLATASADAVCVSADATSTVQEAHLVAVHLLCAAVDRSVADAVQLQGLAEALR